MRLDWEAAYLDGRSAARRRATVSIGRTALQITLADSGNPVRLAGLSQELTPPKLP